jgi:hypothetical protein
MHQQTPKQVNITNNHIVNQTTNNNIIDPNTAMMIMH